MQNKGVVQMENIIEITEGDQGMIRTYFQQNAHRSVHTDAHNGVSENP